MRGLIILCFSALAVAAPEGYNYQQGSSGYQTVIPTVSLLQPQLFGQGQQGLIESSHGNINSQFVQQHSGSFGVSHHGVGPAHRQEVVVSKRFFIHSAPEEHDQEFSEKVLTVGTPRKNYNVVFIRAPSKSTKKASIKITPAPHEEKTVIYVLSKKTDITDIDAQVQEVHSATHKPEVYFIKYKTNEEAAHAQQKIQAEYDSLGGSTQVSNEGIAPVSSVIGALGDKQVSGGISISTSGGAHLVQDTLPISSGSVLNTGNTYLPANVY